MTEQQIIDVLMQYVGDLGFAIIDLGLVSHGDTLRFDISKQGKRSRRYLDIDRVMWNDLSHDGLISLADAAMKSLDMYD